MELPDIVNEINKKKKTTKITTLNEAKSFLLKRYFSGSFGVDFMTGGGFAYRRIQLLFGAKSSGKNALLNQTTSYLQRTCKTCNKLLPEYSQNIDIKRDFHSFILKNILGYGTCTCDNPTPKKVLFLDFERSLSIEEPRDVKIPKYTDIKTGNDVDGLDYTDAVIFIEEMREKESLTQKEKDKIKKCEAIINNTKIEENVIRQLATEDYLIKCGVNTDQLLVADPEDTEEGIEIVKDVIKSKQVDMIVWDSLQAATPRYIVNRDADEATMGIEAKQNGLLMRHVCSAFAAADLTDESEAYKPALIITSQVRSTIGGFVSRPDSYSGGNALGHHIALAMELKREKFLRADGTEAPFTDDFYGQSIRIRADKNKLSSPGNIHNYNYFFREGGIFPIGIDAIGEIIDLGIKSGRIDRAGPYYSVGSKKFQGLQNLKDHCRKDTKMIRDLYVNTMSSQ